MKSSQKNQSHATPIHISMDQLRSLRMRAQGMSPRLPPGSLPKAVQAVIGVNAQLPSAMALSLRARVEGLTTHEIEKAQFEERNVVRTWCMRGTLHLLPAANLEWLLGSINPAQIQAGWRWLQKRGGLERDRAAQVLEAARTILKDNGPLTRNHLMETLAARYGPDVKSAAAGVVHLNGMLGQICFGPDHGAHPTYAELESWLGRGVKDSLEPDLVRVARHYLRGYGPAAPHDLAGWWGMGLTQAKAAWAQLGEELVEVNAAGERGWMLQADLPALEDLQPPDQSVRLLPAFDTYLLGYKHRDFAVAPKYQGRVFHGGEIAPTILIDGFAAGTWRYARSGKRMRIRATPFSAFTPEMRDGISAEAQDIGRFYGLGIELVWELPDD